jgi:hypothetical protein
VRHIQRHFALSRQASASSHRAAFVGVAAVVFDFLHRIVPGSHSSHMAVVRAGDGRAQLIQANGVVVSQVRVLVSIRPGKVRLPR